MDWFSVRRHGWNLTDSLSQVMRYLMQSGNAINYCQELRLLGNMLIVRHQFTSTDL
jgi:hypothetical protein